MHRYIREREKLKIKAERDKGLYAVPVFWQAKQDDNFLAAKRDELSLSRIHIRRNTFLSCSPSRRRDSSRRACNPVRI